MVSRDVFRYSVMIGFWFEEVVGYQTMVFRPNSAPEAFKGMRRLEEYGGSVSRSDRNRRDR